MQYEAYGSSVTEIGQISWLTAITWFRVFGEIIAGRIDADDGVNEIPHHQRITR
jgi:hypothetical protein